VASVHDALNTLAVERGVSLGKIAQPLRVALAGGPVSPPIDQTVAVLGFSEVAARVVSAIEFIDRSQAAIR
jgi:glutamyl-tRNA synthetase